jgi:hypothetical protein
MTQSQGLALTSLTFQAPRSGFSARVQSDSSPSGRAVLLVGDPRTVALSVAPLALGGKVAQSPDVILPAVELRAVRPLRVGWEGRLAGARCSPFALPRQSFAVIPGELTLLLGMLRADGLTALDAYGRSYRAGPHWPVSSIQDGMSFVGRLRFGPVYSCPRAPARLHIQLPHISCLRACTTMGCGYCLVMCSGL